MKASLGVATLLAVLSTPLSAQKSAPVAVPLAYAVPDAKDTPYPGGTMALDIDASDVQRGLYRVTQTVPLAAGLSRITLLFPQWLPGQHGPRGNVSELVDLRFTANGQTLKWRRDPLEVHAFHVDLPAGVRSVTARFLHTSPLQASEGRITMTAEMLNLQWEKMSLYPAGHYVRRIKVKPTVTLPAGWTAAVALDGQSVIGNRVTWNEVDYETLIDSPIFAGAHFRRWDIGNGMGMSVVADEPALLDAKPEHIATMRALGQEALIAFGGRAWDRYEFLIAMTDRMGGIGLEHHRSSENQLEPKALTEWAAYDWDRNVLSHELAHSWNGKFRRPARLWTPDYRTPMQGDLLWVYEGQTQFWGMVLAARSGLQTRETVLGMLAAQAGKYAEQPGRGWRSVEDTTYDPVFAARRAKPWASLARDEDYYNEGALVWLEADQLIRAGTAGARGIDDFARAFFGIRDGDWGEVPYEFADVVATLSRVYAYDWAGFLKSRIMEPGQTPPLAGLERAGYRLVWKEVPNPYDKGRFDYAKAVNLMHSIGLALDKDGVVTAVQWGSAAFNAGVVNGTKLIAVDGMVYSADALKQAITGAKGSKAGEQPITLIVKRGDRVLSVPVSYTGGLRWPWIEKAGTAAAGLDLLLAPRRAAGAK